MKFVSFALAALCTVLVLTSPTASAAFITYTGTTAACFGTGCTPTTAVTQDGTDGLFFTPDVTPGFKCTTDATGFCGIGDAAPANGSPAGTLPTGDNFGYFTLLDTTGAYAGDPFTLRITFTSPTVTSGNPATFSATLNGSVTAGSTIGGVRVNFTNPTATFTGVCSSGPCTVPGPASPLGTPYTFTLTLPNSVNITPPANNNTSSSNVAITGSIQDQAQTPEPGTSLLLGSTLVLGALMMRRFRRA